MTNFTPEMIEKAKNVSNADELLALAKENGYDLTAEEAQAYFAQLHPVSSELSDDELDNISGGGCGGNSKPEEPTTVTKYCDGCGQTVLITRRPPDEDIDSYFGVCPVCNKVHFNL